MISTFYERHILPPLIERACGMPRLRPYRQRWVAQASGRVLELGVGTGLNLPYYDPARMEHLVAVDPAAGMHPRAQARAAQVTFPVEVIALDAERIDSPDAQFDTVVTTFTLCTIPDALAALGEARRVLKPGGKLIFCEHGRSPDVAVQRWQDRLTPWWKPLAGGCHLNRDIPALLKAGGFALRTLDTGYAGGPRPFTWLSSGIAQRR